MVEEMEHMHSNDGLNVNNNLCNYLDIGMN